MGIRLYTENSAVPRLRFDTGEPQFIPPSPANPASGRLGTGTQQLDAQNVTRVDNAARPFSGFIGGPNDAAMPARGGETSVNPAAPPTVDDAAENARTGAFQDSNWNPAPRIQDFRFLMAAETARDLRLQVRQDKLEQKLETLSDRMRLADSLIAQIDTKLERARLEQELDAVGSEIRRLRLEHVFDKQPSTTEDAETALATLHAAGTAFQESQPSEFGQPPALDLFA